MMEHQELLAHQELRVHRVQMEQVEQVLMQVEQVGQAESVVHQPQTAHRGYQMYLEQVA
jgi:hypothetical protein